MCNCVIVYIIAPQNWVCSFVSDFEYTLPSIFHKIVISVYKYVNDMVVDCIGDMLCTSGEIHNQNFDKSSVNTKLTTTVNFFQLKWSRNYRQCLL